MNHHFILTLFHLAVAATAFIFSSLSIGWPWLWTLVSAANLVVAYRSAKKGKLTLPAPLMRWEPVASSLFIVFCFTMLWWQHGSEWWLVGTFYFAVAGYGRFKKALKPTS